MDTSKEYIEMCRKAEEIQDAHIVTPSDVIGWVKHKNKSTWRTRVWLPRQDQLQALVDDKFSHRAKAARDVADILEWLPDQSYEKAWLILTMYILYHKKWDGLEWVDYKEFEGWVKA